MKVYNLNEITDSRILYDKKPPRFMLYIILIVIIILIAVITWSMYSIKTYVVKGQGIVTTQNKQFIMSPVSGAVEEIHVEEGKNVKKGDLLLSLKPVQSNLQIEQLNSQLNHLNERIELLVRAQKNISRGTNDFDKKKSSEIEFYNKLNSLQVKMKEFEVKKVTEDSLKEQNYNEEQIQDYKNKASNKIEQAKYEAILEFTNEKKQLEIEVNKLESQKNALAKSLEEYKITATEDGKFHLSSKITMGMVLQAGAVIGSTSQRDEDLIIELNLPSAERAKVKIKDDVEMVVAGLNQSEYGIIEGRVISIAEDVTIDEKKESNNIYFKVQIKPKTQFLKDDNNNKVNLTLGMLTEVRIKYGKTTYLKYALEQIGMK
ncbi:TPA: HlyD family efflux transporter periplasmic adaptor subunit [Bacillus cereus]|uniref:HlyD family secretion protein n=3 Tax=Bacillus cereus TaxID=1396 RepID=A0AAW5KXA6_BACCE|nr:MULTISPECIES: HlyD family efflux transporter periplasmic adaptor subunit [Bacillus cereus group]MCQ6286393.1 HlyD family secretion protein [Bacillus cereus]MCQ6305579.1 HlyD family secretion protein [Bacillus cereus]MCQ6317966.1 HlyD family secretion protein [Bacillus cereus]MCQ6339108.1 HlyD family secretion protein [Bacillus cereus]MCQ6385787.1 HlyD family secretion protein [Bacillus cereus]